MRTVEHVRRLGAGKPEDAHRFPLEPARFKGKGLQTAPADDVHPTTASMTATDRRELRRRLRAARRALGAAQRERLSRLLCQRVADLAVYRNAVRVALYAPFDGDPIRARFMRPVPAPKKRFTCQSSKPKNAATFRPPPAGRPAGVQPLHHCRAGHDTGSTR